MVITTFSKTQENSSSLCLQLQEFWNKLYCETVYKVVTTLPVKNTEINEVLSTSSLSRKDIPLANLSWGTHCLYEMLSLKRKKKEITEAVQKTVILRQAWKYTECSGQNKEIYLTKNRVRWLYEFYMAIHDWAFFFQQKIPFSLILQFGISWFKSNLP